MEYLHTMVRVTNLDETLKFFCEGLGLKEVRRVDNEAGRFTLVFLAAPEDLDRAKFDASGTPLKEGIPMVELTHNWDPEEYSGGRNFGHLAYQVGDVYEVVERLSAMGVTINRPPRDGYMAFVRSPDGISVELLQKGKPQAPKEPWASAENIGSW
ncbi:VOC family protein [Ponticaulis koreensis]|uniref:VOC family protein n=1 Tax=Ponticaulis koreensis TaxID=1123045 RepID=UPI0004821150